MNSIFLTEDVKNRGYSGAKFHEDDLVYVCVASTNDYNHAEGRHDNLPMIMFHAKCLDNVTFFAGEPYYSEFRKLAPEGRTGYIFDLILKNLTPKMLTELLEESRKKGVKEGRNLLRREFSNLLQKEL